ncbi:MAG: hypothetical protein AVDCRST_MAG56-1096, partial [uncultured Cytophagales bacterium]
VPNRPARRQPFRPSRCHRSRSADRPPGAVPRLRLCAPAGPAGQPVARGVRSVLQPRGRTGVLAPQRRRMGQQVPPAHPARTVPPARRLPHHARRPGVEV